MKKSATKRRDGRYMAYAVLSSGRKAVYGDTENDAVERAVRLEEEEKEYSDKIKFTFANVFHHWFLFKLNQIKPQSADRIEVTYNKYFKNEPLSKMDIRKFDTLFYINWFLNVLNNNPMTYKEYQRIMQLFEGVYVFAVDCFGADEMVSMERVKRNIPRNKFIVNTKKEYAVPEDTVSSISAAMREDFYYFSHPAASALLYCNFYLGMRIGELASFKWSDIDFENKIAYIRTAETKHHERDADGKRTGRMVYVRDAETKTRAGNRSIILVDEAVEILRMIKAYHNYRCYNSDYVAYDGNDEVAMVRSLDRTLRRLEKDLNIPTFNSHKIRKTLATKLHNGGVSSREIADMLGHSDISTTERNYIISLEKNLDSMRKRLEDSLKFGDGE
ncbi:MAG: site-specific integrase [Alphaproteobacteria bacterium]|nr:site-specific integrase [Alphaproteobacteria bacterium]